MPSPTSPAAATTIIGCPACAARNRVRPIAHGAPACARCHEPLPWVVDADEATFAVEAEASVPVLLDLWAAWCGPCRAMAPELERLAARHAGHLKVVKVDVDRSPALAARFAALSIPLLVVLSGGQEVDRLVGAQPLAALERHLAPLLAGATAGARS